MNLAHALLSSIFAISSLFAIGVDLNLSKETIEALNKGIELKFSIGETTQPLAEKAIAVAQEFVKPTDYGWVTVATNDMVTATENLNKGVRLKQQIAPETFLAGAGLAIVITSLMLLYKELTKPAPAHSPNDEAGISSKTSIWEKTKQLLKNPCTIATAGLAAGLLLITKSSALADA